MPCKYLDIKDSCKAKALGIEAFNPDRETLENFCRNNQNARKCNRALVYEAYVKSIKDNKVFP